MESLFNVVHITKGFSAAHMKKLIVLSYLILMIHAVFCQCPIPKAYIASLHSTASYPGILDLNIKTDFCALGDGVSDDTPAFVALQNFINSRGNKMRIIIPKGVYRVGQQVAGIDTTDYAYKADAIIKLWHNNDIFIEGEGDSSIIQTNDSLRWGSFYPQYEPLGGTPAIFTVAQLNSFTSKRIPKKYQSFIEPIIKVELSANVSIKDLVLDGNFYPNSSTALHIYKGGPSHSTNDIQLAHDGIRTDGVENLSIDNVKSQRFGRDGLYINNPSIGDPKYKPGQRNCSVKNCTFEYNGRQGMSWCGGDSIFVTGCSFNFTGRGVTYSGPSSGLDIEPESRDSFLTCKNGYFVNCSFRYNKKQQLSFIQKIPQNPTPSNIPIIENNVFNNCLFVKPHGNNGVISVYIQGGGNNFFKNSQIYGPVLTYFNPTYQNGATVFENTLISDCYWNENGYRVDCTPIWPSTNRALIRALNDEGSTTVNCENNLQFYGCTLENYYSDTLIRYGRTGSQGLKLYNCLIDINKNQDSSFIAHEFDIQNCHFNYFNPDNLYITTPYPIQNCTYTMRAFPNPCVVGATGSPPDTNPIGGNIGTAQRLTSIGSDLNDNQTVVYPCPFENYILVTTEKETKGLYLHDMMGKLVYKNGNIEQRHSFNIDTKNIPVGIYFLKIITEELDNEQSYKLVKE